MRTKRHRAIHWSQIGHKRKHIPYVVDGTDLLGECMAQRMSMGMSYKKAKYSLRCVVIRVTHRTQKLIQKKIRRRYKQCRKTRNPYNF